MIATGNGWQYVWNGENRLILASNAEHVVTYAYDYQGRMTTKTVNGSTRRYLWGDYNIIAEYFHTPALPNSHTNYFVWGLDLSGTLQGAGGVGGLLAEIKDGVPYYCAADANGNVTEYLSSNGQVSAYYEYSPFGEIVAHSRNPAPPQLNFTHRFSTKPWCEVTELSEYEFRKYIPRLGRWASRDPIEEWGGIGLYGFLWNEPVDGFDFLGLYTDSVTANFWSALGAGNYEEARMMLDLGTFSAKKLAVLAAALAAAEAAHNQIDHLDEHIAKIETACPGLSPDPNDPNHDPVQHWLKEIRAAVKNLKQYLKKMPKNKLKKDPIEKAIQRGEEFLKRAEEAGKGPCPSCIPTTPGAPQPKPSPPPPQPVPSPPPPPQPVPSPPPPPQPVPSPPQPLSHSVRGAGVSTTSFVVCPQSARRCRMFWQSSLHIC